MARTVPENKHSCFYLILLSEDSATRSVTQDPTQTLARHELSQSFEKLKRGSSVVVLIVNRSNKLLVCAVFCLLSSGSTARPRLFVRDCLICMRVTSYE